MQEVDIHWWKSVTWYTRRYTVKVKIHKFKWVRYDTLQCKFQNMALYCQGKIYISQHCIPIRQCSFTISRYEWFSKSAALDLTEWLYKYDTRSSPPTSSCLQMSTVDYILWISSSTETEEERSGHWIRTSKVTGENASVSYSYNSKAWNVRKCQGSSNLQLMFFSQWI